MIYDSKNEIAYLKILNKDLPLTPKITNDTALKKHQSFVNGNTVFDSKEELYFSFYLDELYKAGYISAYEPQPESYVLSPPIFFKYTKQLKTKTKQIVKKLTREHIYSPDFKILWTEKAYNVFSRNIDCNADLKAIPFITNCQKSIIEIKPIFDQNNMTRLFTINAKWMYQRHGIYVQKIIPVKLFEATFTPRKYLLTDKTNRPRKLKYQPKTLNDFISQR